ncbi:MAG: GIY-YIG nuclease family protein [Imperialibacter sp.]
MMVTQGKIKDRVSDSNWFVYALKLDDNRYYIGIAVDPVRRFLEHQAQGKNCSSWCKKYRALEIVETIDTGHKHMKDATLMEDLLTLQYITKFGATYVRGGRYMGSDQKVQKASEHHIRQGYITIMHRLLQQFKITYDDLSKLRLESYVLDNRNEPYINNIITTTSSSSHQKEVLLKKIAKAREAI